jgi:starch synthase (maltosyl-transferring)
MPRPNRPSFDRVVIENVTPCVDAGRHPAKSIVGEDLVVAADLYLEGHMPLRGVVRYRGPRERRWRSARLVYEYEPDRWTARIPLDRLGTWRFDIEAWPDPWAGWREDLAKRLQAGQDLSPELVEGARLLRRAAKSLPNKATLEAAAARLGDPSVSVAVRTREVLAAEAADWIDAPLEAEALTRFGQELCVLVERERARFSTWYEMFPRSHGGAPGRHGTFADAARRLPALAELGFDVVYLPPVHPIGRTHRKGPNNSLTCAPDDVGSPWAIGAEEGGHTALQPELGSVADFERFVAEARSLGIDVALDYALQCSPDHPWVREHPEWFHQRADGTIRYAENPPKKYQDIYPLDFWCPGREELWQACLEVLRFWIERGVSIFRVDNPHTKPFAFWEWVLGEVRAEHPEVIFLSEAFTRPKRMHGLAKLGFTQSYTHFTWKNTSWELRELMQECSAPTALEYFRPNLFANTPDILHEYLQKGGRPAFRVRLVLAATLSPSYGIYSGFELCENVPLRPGSEEYLDSEKYQLRWRDYEAEGNLNEDLRLLNQIRREHPALQRLDNLRLWSASNEQILWYQKSGPEGELFVAVNLDPAAPQEANVQVPVWELGLSHEQPFEVEDLLTGARYTWRGEWNWVRLDPALAVAHVLRLRLPGNGSAR